jgi:hypothetical protein
MAKAVKGVQNWLIEHIWVAFKVRNTGKQIETDSKELMFLELVLQ